MRNSKVWCNQIPLRSHGFKFVNSVRCTKVFINIKLHTNITHVVYSFTDIPSKNVPFNYDWNAFLVLAP